MAETKTIDESLVSRLRCPMTLSELELSEDGGFLVATVGGLRYPVREGIPQMLVDEATLPDGVESIDALKQKLRDEGETVRD